MARYYRKKPVVIEAVQFNGSTSHKRQIIQWMNGGDYPDPDAVHTRDMTILPIETDAGKVVVHAHDWVIKGLGGEFYPCKPDIFDRTYEDVGQ